MGHGWPPFYAETKYKLFGNPTLSTTRPEVVQKEMRVLGPDEMQVFIEEVMKVTQRIAILTDLFTGLRVGKLLAGDCGPGFEKADAFHQQEHAPRGNDSSLAG